VKGPQPHYIGFAGYELVFNIQASSKVVAREEMIRQLPRLLLVSLPVPLDLPFTALLLLLLLLLLHRRLLSHPPAYSP
jgi:hypothetical protein